MSAPAGPRGGPAPPPPDMPDLSHLTEEERKIILAVMDRQKKEEEKEQSVLKWRFFFAIKSPAEINISSVWESDISDQIFSCGIWLTI